MAVLLSACVVWLLAIAAIRPAEGCATGACAHAADEAGCASPTQCTMGCTNAASCAPRIATYCAVHDCLRANATVAGAQCPASVVAAVDAAAAGCAQVGERHGCIEAAHTASFLQAAAALVGGPSQCGVHCSAGCVNATLVAAAKAGCGPNATVRRSSADLEEWWRGRCVEAPLFAAGCGAGNAPVLVNACSSAAYHAARVTLVPALEPRSPASTSMTVVLIAAVATFGVVVVAAVVAFILVRFVCKNRRKGRGKPRRPKRELTVSGVQPDFGHAIVDNTAVTSGAAATVPDDDAAAQLGQLAQAGQWTRRKAIGRGASGSVHTCVMGDGTTLAMKEIHARTATPDDARRFVTEMHLMSATRMPHVVTLYHAEYSREERCVRLFMEYIRGGSVGRHVRKLGKPLPEGTLQGYVLQAVLALRAVHRAKVTHRDVKGDNLLLTSDGTVKLADFGSAFHARSRPSSPNPSRPTSAGSDPAPATAAVPAEHCLGSAQWMPPEVANPEHPCAAQAATYGAAGDIWSLGVTVVELADEGRLPWPNFESPWQALLHVGQPEAAPILPAHLSRRCRDFVRQCMRPDPRDRPSAAHLLRHAWLARRYEEYAAAQATLALPAFDIEDVDPEAPGGGSVTPLRSAIATVSQQLGCSDPSVDPSVAPSGPSVTGAVGGTDPSVAGTTTTAESHRRASVPLPPTAPAADATPDRAEASRPRMAAVPVTEGLQDIPSLEPLAPPQRSATVAPTAAPTGPELGQLESPPSEDPLAASAREGAPQGSAAKYAAPPGGLRRASQTVVDVGDVGAADPLVEDVEEAA